MHWFVGPYADSGQTMIVRGVGDAAMIGEDSWLPLPRWH
jgi:hypothetical protein